jgi:AbrB family looped-hinge helix DNA binding protein
MKISSKRQISVPKKVMEALNLKPGDEVDFDIEGNAARLVAIKTLRIPRDQAWFWTPDWQAKEKEADEDLAAGRYRDFAGLEALLKDLRDED